MANVGVYIPPLLQERMQHLKEKGVDLPVSTICQKALEAAVEAEERALRGDRLQRVLARLKSTKTPTEQMAAEGEAAGRRWAEEVGALSELRRMREVRETIEANSLGVDRVELGSHHGSVSFVQYKSDEVEPWGSMWIPGNLPHEFFERAAKPRDRVVYIGPAFDGFLSGVMAVLDVVEKAMEMEPPADVWQLEPAQDLGAGSDDPLHDVDPNDIPF